MCPVLPVPLTITERRPGMAPLVQLVQLHPAPRPLCPTCGRIVCQCAPPQAPKEH